ncbi:MAG TPA: ribbon-helix-helix domain-containing protein, partial [Candidatus Rifleibacterium sp.]|nr:ribbon-helix-helix domain-containing protein [Candidatus Rifleibacterium sp.]
MKKADTVTFKVDPNLLEILQAMPNRSEFIRSAILNALDHVCPLCSGAGVLSPSQKKCWDKFAEKHEIKKCSETDQLLFL